VDVTGFLGVFTVLHVQFYNKYIAYIVVLGRSFAEFFQRSRQESIVRFGKPNRRRMWIVLLSTHNMSVGTDLNKPTKQ